MAIKDHLKEYTMIYTAGATLLALLGGSVAITLPADEKIAKLDVQSTARFKQIETQYAQTWQQQQTWMQEQQRYHTQREIDDIQWQMKYLSNEINRITQISEYLERDLTPQEEWQLDQLKDEWSLLQQRLHQLTQ